MDRFFLFPTDWSPERLSLAGEEGHHAVRVMRKKVGDCIEVFDGAGRWARGEVTTVERAGLTMDIREEGTSPEVATQVSLAVSVPKGKTMDLVVQKAVELGVNRIQPLVTTNSVVKIGEKDAAEKSQKWQRVALEACKQCGQNFLPVVEPVKTLTHYLAEERQGEAIIASLAPGAVPVRETLEGLPDDCGQVSFLVGPEGDFSLSEVGDALAAGFRPVSLGEIVLRVETACLFLASSARYRF
ncbi:MAG: RsmE family RNA methyltransferase [Roseibacillus sp.]